MPPGVFPFLNPNLFQNENGLSSTSRQKVESLSVRAGLLDFI